MLAIDDMLPKADDAYRASLWPKLQAVRETLLCHPAFVSSERESSNGVILAVRRSGAVSTGSAFGQA